MSMEKRVKLSLEERAQLAFWGIVDAVGAQALRELIDQADIEVVHSRDPLEGIQFPLALSKESEGDGFEHEEVGGTFMQVTPDRIVFSFGGADFGPDADPLDVDDLFALDRPVADRILWQAIQNERRTE